MLRDARAGRLSGVITFKERRQALRKIERVQLKREGVASGSPDPSSIPLVWLALPGAW